MDSNVTVRPKAALATVALGALALSAGAARAQDDPRPGFNLFSVQQDVEIGRQSAAQAERQLPVLRDPWLERYLNRVIQPLVEAAPGARYPYRVRAVDAAEVNAFAFPGGPLYVNRGLLEATRSEGELAGVLAHEIAHIALRHGTHQASRAYAAQAGIGILGGLLGRDRGTSTQVIQAVGGLGLNAAFLRFSRNDEQEADLAGIRMMKRAGYDPAAMASFFGLLKQQESRDPSRLEQFFSSHPAPADRAARMQAEAERLGGVERARASADFDSMHERLQGRPFSQQRTARMEERGDRGGRGAGRAEPPVIDRPSASLRTFEQRDGFFEVDYPSNWRAYPATSGYGVTLAPPDGIQWLDDRRQNVVCAVIINHYDPFDAVGSGSSALDDATDDLVAEIRRSSPYLRAVGSPQRHTRVDRAAALSVDLEGVSPATGETERVRVLTRELTDGHVLYALFVAPRDQAARLQPAFDDMVDSLRVNDRVVHR
jgi:Zn-dependent protease with chaperone function